MDRPSSPIPFDVFSAACPSRTVLDIIGARWTVLIIGALEDGPRRFGELERAAGGISAKVLTQVLRSLERDGLVTRTLYPEVPPHTEYALTPLGQDLVEPLRALRDWSEAHIEQILESRERVDAARSAATSAAG
ncbi:MAG: helix-turn-helix domain-containing protein [Chloroflexota bacterium]